VQQPRLFGFISMRGERDPFRFDLFRLFAEHAHQQTLTIHTHEAAD
jgi:hypothetical protein